MRLTPLVLVLLTASASAQTGCGSEIAPMRDAALEADTTASGGPDAMRSRVYAVPLGEGAVGVAVHERPGGRLDALVLHDDEDTGVEAALDVIRAAGGRLVELRHSGERNVTFASGGASYTADPNRVFTDGGRARTLASLSADAPEARATLAIFADSLRALYTASGPAVVVTLHNNTEGNYSAASYASGGEYARDAEAVAIHDGADPDDFFFVTDRALYDALVARGFNAVLQDNARATDDGSLSVWAAQNARPYVNVEAQHGHVAEQERMIRALVDVLSVPPTE